MFRKYFFLVIGFIVISVSATHGQNPSRVTIRGVLQDTSGAEVVTATVMLLNPADSTLVSFTASDKTGGFRFSNVRNDPYLLKVSHVAYMPLQMPLDRSAITESDLGVVKLTPFSQILMQVVVRDAKAPIRIHGDTIEYDVSTFKVPPGSTVEDLLRRLPGIEVDASGNVSAQGKDVKRIYVDGKSFFGDDPKTVTQNMGLEAISKVQVFDEKSEQTRLTGVADGSRDKAMNLELREEFKKGAFGKATLAGGTEETWAAKANYNRFDEKRQISFIGYANNINQSGVNWEDYREFMGQNSFSGYDNGDFGFSEGGGGRVFQAGSTGIPISRDSDRGYSKNHGAGTNYNFDHNKLKYNASYFYNQSSLWYDQFSLKQTYLPDSAYFTKDTLGYDDFRGNHSFATRLEKEIDSNRTFIARMNLSMTHSLNQTLRNQWFSGEEGLVFNHLSSDNETDNLTVRLSTTAIYGQKFTKPGRAIAASAAYSLLQSDDESDLHSVNRFFAATDFTEQIRQLNTDHPLSQTIKSSLLYTDAFSKKFFMESFYNFRLGLQEKDKRVTDGVQAIDSLSIFYKNDVLYNRLGTSLRFAHKGTNASVGVALQNIELTGAYAGMKGEPWITKPLERSFLSVIPNASIRQEFPNRMWLEGQYAYEVNEPSFTDLQPVPVISNPLYRTEGNPDLQPEKMHTLSSSLNYWAPASFASFGMNASYNLYDSRIVYNMTTEFIDSVGFRTTTKPENVAGGDNFSSWLWTSVPIIKTVLTLNLNGNFNLGHSQSYVNNVLNQTESMGYGGGAGISLSPGSKLLLSVNGRLSYRDISYSIQKQQDQNIENHSLNATVRYQFIEKTFFESNFNYNLYKNDRFGFDQSVPLWNASLRRIMGKKNRFEARLAAFDIFNKRLGISQSGADNYAMQSTTATLARYYMLSVSYNLRGYDLKMQQGGRRAFF